jgi:hypothetical protein
MNKFLVAPCSLKNNKEGYSGQIVSLICSSKNGLAICFPISEENANIINRILERLSNKDNIDVDVNNTLSIYKTMVDSWNSGGKFLSGIYMDMELDDSNKIEIISTKAIISNNNDGYIDNIVKINFVHAITIAAMYKFEIIISKELIEKLLPTLENEDEDETKIENKKNNLKKTDNIFPKDKQILKIVKKIMNGKIK